MSETTPTPQSSRIPTSPLQIGDFWLFLLARFSASFAAVSMVVIIGWQVYDVARADYGMSIKAAAGMVGVLGLIQFIPLFVLTPVSGWVADRYERTTIARLANLIDLCVALTLGYTTANGMLSLPLLFLLAAAHGSARAFVGPAMSSIGPNIVPAALLPRAIAMSTIAWQAAAMLGPALSGFMYADHPALPYWVAAGLMMLAVIALTFVRDVEPPAMEPRHPVRQMIDGLHYVGKDRFLLGAITLDLFAVLLGGATAMLPVFARDILHVGPEGLGQLRAAPAVGAALVTLLLAIRPMENNVGVKMLWAVAIFGGATIGFGLSKDFQLSLLFLAILGGADALSVYVRSSLVQLNTPDGMRGRVSSVSGLAISASNELGEAQSGLAAALLGAVGGVVFGGAAAILVTALWAWWFPELRNARTFEPQYKEAKT